MTPSLRFGPTYTVATRLTPGQVLTEVVLLSTVTWPATNSRGANCAEVATTIEVMATSVSVS